MNLKNSDLKLLNYLYHNSSEPATKIAKATNLSREQVEYRIKKYLFEGKVTQFFTYINYPKLGYGFLATLLLKAKPGKEKEFLEKLEKDKHCLSKGEVIGDYDLYMDMVFRDEKEMNEYVSSLFQKNKNHLVDYLILKSFFAEYYHDKFFLQKPEKQQKPGRFEIAEGLEKEKIRIDDKDRIILKMLSHDARVKIVDMAEKIALTPEAVLYRLRRLEKDKVILGSSMIFNTNKLGYYFADLLIEINPFSSEIQERIKKASRQNKRINHLLFLVNQPNCLIQIIFKTQEELEETIKEIKSLFQDEYAKVKILFPKIEEKINTLPFY
jgi:DNA-binding Lrp family transcriptional regulator